MIKQRWKSNCVGVWLCGWLRAGGSSQGQGECEGVWAHRATCECGEGSSQAGLESSAQGTLNFLSTLSNNPRQIVRCCKSSMAHIDVMWNIFTKQSGQESRGQKCWKGKMLFRIICMNFFGSLLPSIQLQRSQVKTDIHCTDESNMIVNKHSFIHSWEGNLCCYIREISDLDEI